jgi:hypothetical protein
MEQEEKKDALGRTYIAYHVIGDKFYEKTKSNPLGFRRCLLEDIGFLPSKDDPKRTNTIPITDKLSVINYDGTVSKKKMI